MIRARSLLPHQTENRYISLKVFIKNRLMSDFEYIHTRQNIVASESYIFKSLWISIKNPVEILSTVGKILTTHQSAILKTGI